MGGPRHVLVLTSHELSGIRELLQLVADDADGTFDHRLVRRAQNLVRQTADVPLTDVVVQLTVSEAQALDRAAGNTTDAPDAMEAVFPKQTKRDAAYRAAQKLADAIQERLRGRSR